jgi:hypothetical protein
MCGAGGGGAQRERWINSVLDGMLGIFTIHSLHSLSSAFGCQENHGLTQLQ